MFPIVKIRKKQNQETRWNRIERKHINAIKLPNRTAEGPGSYLSYLRNKTFFKDYHIKMLNGDDSLQNRLDPNLVMNIRHENIKQNRKRIGPNDIDTKSTLSKSHCPESINHKNGLFPNTQFVNKEIEKFRDSMESKRPMPAQDFFDYLNNFDKYKFINMKLNRFRDERELAKLNNVCCDFEPSSICEFGIETKEPATNHSNAKIIFCDSSMEEPLLISDRSLKSYSDGADTTYRDENDENAEVYPDFNKCSMRTEMKVEVVPKLRSASRTKLELCGMAANIAYKEDMPPQTVEEETNATDISLPLPEETTYQHEFRHDIKKTPSSDLTRNLKIIKMNIDQPKPALSHKRRDENGMDDEEIANAEKNAIICELFCERNRSNFRLLQKYFLKWFHFNTMEKLSKQPSSGVDQTRLKKIQKFLQTISTERKVYAHRAKTKAAQNEDKSEAAAKRRDAADDPVILARKYKSKLKIQQDIIELQRVKLERQERMITELKLSKLSEEAREAQMELKKELRQVIQTGNQQARSKARCLQMIGNLREEKDEEEYAILQAKGLTMPKFLVEMQARALERETKHQQAKERRENLEKEKEDQRLAVEEAKRLQDEEAKRQRIEELRLKRREERLQKIQLEKERLAYRANLKRAEDYHRKKLLQFVFNRFRILILLKKRYERLAREFLCNKLRRDILRRWNNHVVCVWQDRKMRADMCHNKQCLRSIMEMWKKYYLVEHSKKLVADDWCEMKRCEKAFGAWNCITTQSRLAMEIKMRQAATHYEWNLKWRVLDHWRRLPDILRIEKETEKRRERWRNKIWEVLPDYTPNDEDT